MRRQTRPKMSEAERLLASLVKAATRPKPRHKWPGHGRPDLRCWRHGIMGGATRLRLYGGPAGRAAWSFTSRGAGTRRALHLPQAVPVSGLSEPQLNMAMIAQVVLAQKHLRRGGCQEPEMAFWLLCKKHGFDEERSGCPSKSKPKGFPAIATDMEETLSPELGKINLNRRGMGIALSYGMNNSDRIKVIRVEHKYELLRPLMTGADATAMGRLRGDELSPRRFHPRRSGHGFVSDDLVGRQSENCNTRPGCHQERTFQPGTDCLPEDQSQTATEDRPDGAPFASMGKTLRWGEKEWRKLPLSPGWPCAMDCSRPLSATLDGSRSGV